ncbi:class I SAM-dependent methyltransferase [Desulfosporosinus sp. Sb-LF]|uniref:class I SAM-dependent methyltransferase n=1 Tax=Desulfosporosinus sp. Sb-LF TaxID=2560027 RepID=UPI001FB165BD|nr:class I SAM-dependent methyltransferase [Desulfosporosinus sp. Sb-LF]
MDFRLGHADKLPIADESVDYVFANMFLHHVEIPLRAIEEMTRVLKPKGKLLLTDLDVHEYEFLRVEQHDRWLGFERNYIKDCFSKAGLHNILIDCIGTNCCAKSSCGDNNASVSVFVAVGTK